MLKKISLCALFVLAAPAHATTLTAVCKEPEGYAIGFRGALGKHQKVDGPDGFSGGMVSISWPSNAERATIVVQGSGGRSIHSGPAVPVFRSPEMVSFVAVYPAGVFLYSVFLESKTLMVSDHGLSLGIEPGSAVNRAMQARCGISVQ